jgi:hypothetical protein
MSGPDDPAAMPISSPVIPSEVEGPAFPERTSSYRLEAIPPIV